MSVVRKTDMGTLSDFLLARIAEDETDAMAAKSAQESMDDPGDHWSASTDGDTVYTSRIASYVATGPYAAGLGKAVALHIARHDPARILAECEAKRRIVGDYRRMSEDAKVTRDPDVALWALGLDKAMRLLATSYTDHPDYREEWKP